LELVADDRKGLMIVGGQDAVGDGVTGVGIDRAEVANYCVSWGVFGDLEVIDRYLAGGFVDIGDADNKGFFGAESFLVGGFDANCITIFYFKVGADFGSDGVIDNFKEGIIGVADAGNETISENVTIRNGGAEVADDGVD
jgi:hypothetical protein